MSRIRAQFIQEYRDFARDTVRLALREETFDRYRYLLADGTWSEWSEAGSLPPDVGIGIELPRAAVQEIASAIEEFQGAAAHAPTVEKILRESLEVERARVDRVLQQNPDVLIADPSGQIEFHPRGAGRE